MGAKLEQIGAALYGPRWQSEMARALGVSDRQVRRWIAGDSPEPPTLKADLERLVSERIKLLRSL